MLVHEEVRTALDEGRPVVALESTIIAHGLPRPDNLRVAREIEGVVREQRGGAGDDRDPRRGGADRPRRRRARGAGLLRRASPSAACATWRRWSRAARTARRPSPRPRTWPSAAGIRVFATGGLGGVHRGARDTFDESADLGHARARRDLRRVRGREVDPRHPRDARAARDAERHRARLPDRHVPGLLPDVVRAAGHRGGWTRPRRPPRCCARARRSARPARSSSRTRSTSRWTRSCTSGCCARGSRRRPREGIARPRRDPVPARALPLADARARGCARTSGSCCATPRWPRRSRRRVTARRRPRRGDARRRRGPRRAARDRQRHARADLAAARRRGREHGRLAGPRGRRRRR